MSQSNCYLNGKFCPIESANLPISDLGFIHGVTVTEQLRTFDRTPFLLAEHLDRFNAGLRLLEISIDETQTEIASIVDKMVSQFLDATENEECGIGFFATPGSTARFGQPQQSHCFCIYCYPLPDAEWEELYENGCRLKISSFQDVDHQSWPKNVKVRSRLHYYLSDLEAKKTGQVALLADHAGFLRDTSTAAPVFVFDEGQLSIPPAEDILNSISLGHLTRLADELQIKIDRRPIHLSELPQLKAMALANSLFCLAKVAEIDGHVLAIESPTINSLVEVWKNKSGVDFERRQS